MQSIFEILFLVGSLGKISKENLICYISGAECRRKLKFGEVGLQICRKFWRKRFKRKNFRPDCFVKRELI